MQLKNIIPRLARILSACCIGILFAARAWSFNADAHLAFAANLTAAGPCHPSSPEGADLFLGLLDLQNGTVFDMRLVAGGVDPQWLPAFSRNGKTLVYQNGLGSNARCLRLDLESFEPPRPAKNHCLAGVLVSLPETNGLCFLDMNLDAFFSNAVPWHGWIEAPQALKLELRETDQDFLNCENIALMMPAFAGSNAVVATAVALNRASGGKWQSVLARLVLLRFFNGNASVAPLRFAGFEDASFPVQSCTSDAFPGHAPLPENAPPLFVPGPKLASSATSFHPDERRNAQVFVIVTARAGSGTPAGQSDFAGSETAFRFAREHVLKLALFCSSNQIPWTLQTDLDFVEGVLRYDLQGSSVVPGSTNAHVNVLVAATQLGAAIGPIANQSTQYNEADVARMIEKAGVKPAPVMGWYPFEPISQREKTFAACLSGIRGLRYPEAIWTPSIMAGAGVPATGPPPIFSGIWRPASAKTFFEHDPKTRLVIFGDKLFQQDIELVTLLDRIRRKEVPAEGPYVLRTHIVLPDTPVARDFDEFLNWRFINLLNLRKRGELELVGYTELLQHWRDRYGERGFIFNLQAARQD